MQLYANQTKRDMCAAIGRESALTLLLHYPGKRPFQPTLRERCVATATPFLTPDTTLESSQSHLPISKISHAEKIRVSKSNLSNS